MLGKMKKKTIMEIYIQIIVTAICTIAYVLTFKYQSSKIKILERTFKTLNDQVSSQSKIITDFEKYKNIFDIDDFEKRMNLKLDILRDELKLSHKKEIEEIQIKLVKDAIDVFQKTHQDVISKNDELSIYAANIAIEKYPKLIDKKKRDEFVLNNFPLSHDYLNIYIDQHFSTKHMKADQ